MRNLIKDPRLWAILITAFIVALTATVIINDCVNHPQGYQQLP